jgi:hypothetical protein
MSFEKPGFKSFGGCTVHNQMVRVPIITKGCKDMVGIYSFNAFNERPTKLFLGAT